MSIKNKQKDTSFIIITFYICTNTQILCTAVWKFKDWIFI